MNSLKIILLALIITFGATAYAGWQDFFKEQLESWSESDSKTDIVAAALTNKEMIGGLKQALEKGAEYAVNYLGKSDGFLANQSVKIPMPDKLKTVEKILRKLGRDKYADEFVLTMNRAAESAVPLTLGILKQAVTAMTFDDVKGILNGPNDAATQYLRKTGWQQMYKKIAPIVAAATARAGVTKQYKKLFDKLGFMNQVLDPSDYDIDKYVTEKTLEGLFFMVAEEERKIRENPLKRTTDLLRKVFSG